MFQQGRSIVHGHDAASQSRAALGEPEDFLHDDNRPLTHPRDEIIDTMQRIYSYKMTTTSGGNISIRDAADDIWITPARIDKGSLTRWDIVCLRADGTTE